MSLWPFVNNVFDPSGADDYKPEIYCGFPETSAVIRMREYMKEAYRLSNLATEEKLKNYESQNRFF